MKLKTIIVDDEFPALQLISSYCERLPGIELVKTFSGTAAAMEHIKANTTDLLLLDIQMPGMNGIELMKQLPQPPVCIFITANPAHAVNAYELEVTDYLVKPVSFERFKKSIDKAAAWHAYRHPVPAATPGGPYLVIKAGHNATRINTADIGWIEGSGEYVKIVTAEKTFLVLDSLTNYMESILPPGFLRIHKSYIVSLSQVSQFTATGVTLKNKKELPIGRSYKEEVMRILKT